MHITSTVPNLIGGVSQQPERLRLPSHMKQQEHSMCDPAKGLHKRPPTLHRAQLSGLYGEGLYHILYLGERGAFHLNIKDGVVRVFAHDGTEIPVTVDESVSLAYLVTMNPMDDLKVHTEADTTFIINSKVVVDDIRPAESTARWDGMIWIKAGNYGRTYSITIPNYGTASYTTPDGSVANHINSTRTDYIATQLASSLTANGVPGVTANGSVINFGEGGFDGMSFDDGMGATSMGIVYKSVRDVGELPATHVKDGFTIKIEGGDDTAAGDYYLRFRAEDAIWAESVHPREGKATLDQHTLPIRLVPSPDNSSFTLLSSSWGSQTVGDSESNPGPSFIGSTLNGMFFHRDRMGFISGENFDLSEAGEYFNFYRKTVTDLIDSDPISGTCTHSKVSTLRHAVSFNKRLVFFSDSVQFELEANGLLTPKTASTQQLTEYDCSHRVRPQGIGSALYFAADRGEHTVVYNLYVTEDSNVTDAADITAHAPEYVPKNVFAMEVSALHNIIFALSKDDPSGVYVHQFYLNGQERLQSAWHHWPFPEGETVRAIRVVKSNVIMVIERPDGVFVETLVLGREDGLAGELYSAALDRKFIARKDTFTVVQEDAAKYTIFPMPYPATYGEYAAVVLKGQTREAGRLADVRLSEDGMTAAVLGDFTGCDMVVGRRYKFLARIGTLMVREQVGNGSVGISRGRTQIGRVWVNYAKAATFSILVALTGRTPVEHKSTGRTLGGVTSKVGVSPITDGRFGCPVRSENTNAEITIVNDTPLPSAFLSVDWEGYHVSRGQRV